MAKQVFTPFDIGPFGMPIEDPGAQEQLAAEAQNIERARLAQQAAQFLQELSFRKEAEQNVGARLDKELAFRGQEGQRQRAFQGGESAQERAFRRLMQGDQQAFVAGQAGEERAFRGSESAQERAFRRLMQGDQQGFVREQSQLERDESKRRFEKKFAREGERLDLEFAREERITREGQRRSQHQENVLQFSKEQAAEAKRQAEAELKQAQSQHVRNAYVQILEQFTPEYQRTGEVDEDELNALKRSMANEMDEGIRLAGEIAIRRMEKDLFQQKQLTFTKNLQGILTMFREHPDLMLKMLNEMGVPFAPGLEEGLSARSRGEASPGGFSGLGDIEHAFRTMFTPRDEESFRGSPPPSPPEEQNVVGSRVNFPPLDRIRQFLR